MICKDCRDAADVDRQELHCHDEGCSCQHKPIGDCQPVESDDDGDPLTPGFRREFPLLVKTLQAQGLITDSEPSKDAA